MNRYFSNTIFNLHNGFTWVMRPKHLAKDSYLKKKLSDYYFSKIFPNFYVSTDLLSNYSPHVIKSRILYYTIGSLILGRFLYSGLKSNRSQTKKYTFSPVTRSYIDYERKALAKEKSRLNKLFI